MASFVSRELGSGAKTVADTSVSKRYRNKKRRFERAAFPIDPVRSTHRV
jgi:hypothetical protein